jgi:hypothetical protein
MSQPITRIMLCPGDVIYAPGWKYCYQLISGPFCRIHYARWQGHLVCVPSDHPLYVGYHIQVLGGQSVDTILVRMS